MFLFTSHYLVLDHGPCPRTKLVSVLGPDPDLGIFLVPNLGPGNGIFLVLTLVPVPVKIYGPVTLWTRGRGPAKSDFQ